MIIETSRLRLRPLTDADNESYLAMFADPEVMRYVSPVPIPRASAEAVVSHYRQMLETKGYGYWAIEVIGGASFAGIIMLHDVNFTAAFTPAFEVGWLLAPEHWGNGYATEGARAAITAEINLPSRRVMQRLGMTHDPNDDFDHPHVMGTPLQRGVLYRSRRP